MNHSSCTIHSARYWRLHYIREDFECIADNDALNASALRIFQQKTDRRIKDLREKYGIPDGLLPPDDWLWLNDITVRELERWGLHIRCKSTYARALQPMRKSERHPRSLIELGYIRSRYIARRGRDVGPATVDAPVYEDEIGLFIFVDARGSYQGQDGEVRDATDEGYTLIVQQFLYCFDAVNAALAALDGMVAKSAQRWSPKRKTAQPGQETHRNTFSHVSGDAHVDTTTAKAILGGNLDSAPVVNVSIEEDIIESTPLSTGASGDSTPLRYAPWNIDTLLALVSVVLPVPDRATCTAQTWETSWQRPAELLLIATSTLSPMLAWERIDLVIRYMIEDGSPSYWRTGRSQQTPTTLRHVEAHFKDYYRAFTKSQWWPSVTTPYDGPLTVYEQGYTGPAQAPESTETAPPLPELVQVAGMRRKTAQHLADEIWSQYPGLSLGTSPIEGTGLVQFAIEYGPGQWLDLPNVEAWRNPTPETLHYLELAVAFAASEQSAPVGIVEEADEDAPPIIMEPPEHVVEAEPPGLYALPPLPPPVEDQILPPSGQAGMRIGIARRLAESIVKRGYSVEQRDIGADLAVLCVEVRPGVWRDFTSAAQWQEWRSGNSPPTGVGFVAATMAGSAMPQAVSP